MTKRAVLVRRNASLGWAAIAALASFVLAIIVGTLSPATATDLVVAVVAFGWPFVIGLFGAWAGYALARRTDVAVEVRDGALSVDGAPLRAAGELSSGEATVLAEDRVRVELRAARLPRVRLEMRTISAARELLAGLGLDRRTGTSKFRVRRLREYAGLLFAGAFLAVPMSIVLSTVSPWAGFPLLALVVLGPITDALRARVELTVGTDGIDLRSPFGRTFVPHARIRSIEKIWPGAHGRESTHEGEISYGFEIELDDESFHRIDTRSERVPAGGSFIDPTFDAVTAAWSAWKSAGSAAPPTAAALLARGERSTREWLAALRGLASHGGGGYRVAALDEPALFAVLADPLAPRELRAAAAVVLGAHEERAPRLRVAADDVADPIVRRIAVASATSADVEADLDEASRPGEPLRKTSVRPGS